MSELPPLDCFCTGLYGRVQGVYFRFRTHMRARELGTLGQEPHPALDTLIEFQRAGPARFPGDQGEKRLVRTSRPFRRMRHPQVADLKPTALYA